MTKETIVRGERPKRTSIVNQGRLNVQNKDPNREYRFVNDEKGKVEIKVTQGWVIEQSKDHVGLGGARLESASTQGSAARLPVGNGISGVLMSIDRDWYLEDQRERQQRVDATEQSIKNDALNSHKGSFSVSNKLKE